MSPMSATRHGGEGNLNDAAPLSAHRPPKRGARRGWDRSSNDLRLRFVDNLRRDKAAIGEICWTEL